MAQSLPRTFKAAVLSADSNKLEIQDIPMLEVKDGEILCKVHACGVCHTDALIQQGKMGPPKITRLGHEFIGTIVSLSPAASSTWSIGDLVGGPWHGGHDNTCKACKRGLYQMCTHNAINGYTRDGGYGEYATLRSEAAVRIPPHADPAQVAPLLCAGVTVFNGIRRMGITAGDVVAVQGLGGLGHLAVQYARKMGFRTVALSRGGDKRDFAVQRLGANEYVDITTQNVGEELQKMGGAALVVVTAPNPDVISPLLEGLAPLGKVLVHTAIGPVPIDTIPLVNGGLSVCGWPSGHALDSEEAIAFAENQGVECMIEKFPLEKANEAMQRMLSGKARFRVVLTMD